MIELGTVWGQHLQGLEGQAKKFGEHDKTDV